MSSNEFLESFDILYNNITSNQAPGLNAHEISVFLTKAQDEKVKNYLSANSVGNTLKQGFDDSAKRQTDFASLMETSISNSEVTPNKDKIDSRSQEFYFPKDAFIIINEKYRVLNNDLQVIPLRFDEYTRLMSKPFKRPLRNQAWRLTNSGNEDNRVVEIIAGPGTDNERGVYTVRYIRKPKPIIVGSLDGLTINGYCFTGDKETYGLDDSVKETNGCELDSSIHEEILQRAVELAKIAWTSTGQDNAQMVIQAGQRSE